MPILKSSGSSLKREKYREMSFSAIANLMWSSAFLFGKTALTALPPFCVAGIRLVIATAFLFAIVRKNPFTSLARKGRWVLLVAFLQTYISFSIFNLGLALLPGSLGSMIIGVSPAFTSILAFFVLGETLSVKKLAGLGIGITSVVILAISRSPWTKTGASEVLGILLLVCTNLAGAFGNTIVKKHFTVKEIMPLNLVQTGLGACAVCLTSLILERPDPTAFGNLKVTGSIICLAVITAGASSLWNYTISKEKVRLTDIAAWKFLIPSMGAVLSWLFLPNDAPNPVMLVCLFMIAFAIFLSVIELPSDTRKRTFHSG